MKDVLFDKQRQMPTMQMVQNTKVVNPVKTSQVQYIDEIVKDPSDHAEAGADDAEDAERTKGTPGNPVYLNRTSRQESPSAERSTSRGESADKEKAHDEQSRAAPEETVPEEIASMKAPPDMKTGRSMRICLSRVVPVDHEARGQVKVKEKSSCRSEGTQSTQKKRLYTTKFESVGTPACNARKERQNKTRERS